MTFPPTPPSIFNISLVHFISINLFWFADKFVCKPFLLPLHSEESGWGARKRTPRKKKLLLLCNKIVDNFLMKTVIKSTQTFPTNSLHTLLISHLFIFFHSISGARVINFILKKLVSGHIFFFSFRFAAFRFYSCDVMVWASSAGCCWLKRYGTHHHFCTILNSLKCSFLSAFLVVQS